jgi:Uri superfamily endonuclease
LNAIYVLIILIERSCLIKVGALGDLIFQEGVYAYVGSAQSNFRHRIERHYRKEKKLFWHIDYLLNNNHTKIKKIFFKSGKKIEECNLARLISINGKTIPKFGSSDCNCLSHLFQIESENFLKVRLKELNIKHNAF